MEELPLVVNLGASFHPLYPPWELCSLINASVSKTFSLSLSDDIFLLAL